MRLTTCLVACACLCVTVNVANAASACSSVTYVSRAEWNARDPKASSYMANPLGFAVVHHTDGAECTTTSSCEQQVRGIQNYHMDGNGWSDVGYNFLIGGDGRVYIGRGWNTVGAHAGDTFFNQNAAGISILGDYMHKLPTNVILKALEDLLACGVESGHLTTDYMIRGHRDVRSTSCPGDTLYAHLQTWPHYLRECPT